MRARVNRGKARFWWTAVWPAVLWAVAMLLPACSGHGYRMQEVPEQGYEQTLNYQFQAQVFSDEEGECKRVVVRVRPLNKGYVTEPPPNRLQLIDEDCFRPIQFERAQYLSRQNGGLVRLNGPEVANFLGSQVRLSNELYDWLWRAGIN